MDRFARNEVELAWAAGFFDGEGTITITSHKTRADGGGWIGNFYVGVNQSTTDLDDVDVPPVLTRFQAAVGLGVIRGPYVQSAQRRPSFKWYVLGEAAELALERLWPYLTETKRSQADRVRASFAARRAVAS